jgi:hypothetical protein
MKGHIYIVRDGAGLAMMRDGEPLSFFPDQPAVVVLPNDGATWKHIAELGGLPAWWNTPKANVVFINHLADTGTGSVGDRLSALESRHDEIMRLAGVTP